jgi:hypothetical protein
MEWLGLAVIPFDPVVIPLEFSPLHTTQFYFTNKLKRTIKGK